MLYPEVVQGTFVNRPNRFVAWVLLAGQEVLCHVKNTGRLRELLVPGAQVILEKAASQTRKTAFDLVGAYKGDKLVNIDSQAPNQAAYQWLQARYLGARVRREVPWQGSRLDFMVQQGKELLYVEVKGCTLEREGLALFPDAPTQRGVRHLEALRACVAAGHRAMALFVVQMQPVHALAPHDAMHPAFGEALRAAADAGVEVVAYQCDVTPQTMSLSQPLPVFLGGQAEDE